MSVYKLFFIDPWGAVLRRLEIECDTDEGVLRLVARHEDGHDIEVWSGERLVTVHRGARRPPS